MALAFTILMHRARFAQLTFALAFAVAAFPAASQPEALIGDIQGIPNGQTIELRVAHGNGHRTIATTTAGPHGEFSFATQGLLLGFYQIALHDTDRVELILGPHERDVRLHFDGLPLREHIRVDKGPENIRLWNYKRVSRRALLMMQEMRAYRERFPDGVDPLLDSLIREAFQARTAFMADLQKHWPDSYFARVVRTDRAIDAAPHDDPAAVLRAADLSDGSLLRSAVMPKAILAYLQRIEVQDESGFNPAVDTLLAHAGRDTACWNHVVLTLINTFGHYQMDTPLRHIAEVLAATPRPLPASLRDGLNDLLRIAIGSVGPDISLPGIGGDTTMLSDLVTRRPYTLLFFYSSTCGHCHEQMPWLKQMHLMDPRVLVVGIALDDDPEEFTETIRREEVPWPSFTELKAWGSPAAKAYGISATPSFVLLDRDMRIVAKPADEEALRAALGPVKP